MRMLGLLALACVMSAGAETPKGESQMCSGPDRIRECYKFDALTRAKVAVCAPPNDRSHDCETVTDLWWNALQDWRKVMAAGSNQTLRPPAR